MIPSFYLSRDILNKWVEEKNIFINFPANNIHLKHESSWILFKIPSTFTAKIHINSVKIKKFYEVFIFLEGTCLNFFFWLYFWRERRVGNDHYFTFLSLFFSPKSLLTVSWGLRANFGSFVKEFTYQRFSTVWLLRD